jgi:hypothetical protein
VRERSLCVAWVSLPRPLEHQFLGGEPLPRRRTGSSAAHQVHTVRVRAKGAASSKGCGNGPARLAPGRVSTTKAAGAPLPRRRTSSSAPHQFLGGAPAASGARTRKGGGVEQRARERTPWSYGHRRTNFFGSSATPTKGPNGARALSSKSLHSSVPEVVRHRPTPHPLVDAAPATWRRTRCNRCGAEELVRGRRTGAPSTNWCGRPDRADRTAGDQDAADQDAADQDAADQDAADQDAGGGQETAVQAPVGSSPLFSYAANWSILR